MKFRVEIVGREPEMAQLRGALDSALSGNPPLVLILGDTGTGKSFLLDTFLRESEVLHEDLIVACGSGQQVGGRGTSLRPVREFLEQLMGFTEGNSSAVKSTQDINRLRGVRKTLLSSLISNERILTSILPVPTPEQLEEYNVEGARITDWMAYRAHPPELDIITNPQVIQRSIVRLLRKIDAPLAIVFDDLQWVDSASLEIFLALQNELEGRRLILLATARTEAEPSRLHTDEVDIESIESSLSRKDRNLLINLNDVRRSRGWEFCFDLLKVAGFDSSDENVSKFLKMTGANALFARDVLVMLSESHVAEISHSPQTPLQLTAIDWEHLPKNHSGTVARRIQSLSKDAVSYLEIGAVEGQEFTPEVIAKIKGLGLLQVLEILEIELDKQNHLVEDISVHPEQSSFAGVPSLSRFKFSHGYYQQIIYRNRIGPARLKELHLRIALALEELWGTYTSFIAVQLAQHFHLGGDDRSSVRFYGIAAKRNLALADFAGAAFCSETGLAIARLAPADEKLEGLDELFVVGTSSARARGDFTLTANLAKEGLKMTQPISPNIAVKLKSELARSLYNRDTNFEEAESYLREAICDSSTMEDLQIEADLHRQLGIVFQRQAGYTDALGQYLKALTIATTSTANMVAADIINSAGVSFGLAGFFEFAVSCHEKALEMARKLEDNSRITLFLNDSLGPLRRLGRVSDARIRAGESIKLAQDQGKLGAGARATYELAQLSRIEGHWGDYEALLTDVLKLPKDLAEQSPHVPKARAELTLLSMIVSTKDGIETSDVESNGVAKITGTSEMYSLDFVRAICKLQSCDKSAAREHFRTLHSATVSFKAGTCWAWPFLAALASYGEVATSDGVEKESAIKRSATEITGANRRFGLAGVWADVDFYFMVLSAITEIPWNPPKGVQKLRISSDAKKIAELQTDFKSLFEDC